MPDVTRIAQSSLSYAKLLCVVWTTLQATYPDRPLGDDDATFGQQVFDVTKTQIETVAKPPRVTDNFLWEAVAALSGLRFHADNVDDDRST